MTAHLMWVFTDPVTSDTYTFETNPNSMTNPFPARNITSATTTAIGGKQLFFEGSRQANQFSFSGDILTAAHYEALRMWTYDKNYAIYISDHFGRQFAVHMVSFAPVPKRSVGKYWRHTYQILTFMIGEIGSPSVGEV